jgi:hypothetical protein
VQGRAVFEQCSFLHNKASSTGGAGVLIKAYCVSSNRTVQRCRMPFHDNTGNKMWRAPYFEGPAFYNDGGMSPAAPLQFNLFSFVWRSLVCVASYHLNAGECYMNAYNDIQEHGFGPITRPCHKIDS